MSDNINFSGSVERFLKGDADPINLFGFSPNRAELRANEADRARRATQIAFEQESEGLRKAGGSTDPATKQVKKLKESNTRFDSLSPVNPVPLPSVVISGVLTEAHKNEQKRKQRSNTLRRQNKEHADTALTAANLSKKTRSGSTASTRLSERQLRQSILGARAR